MGRDIRVSSKHFEFTGSKSSDLILLFDSYLYEKLHIDTFTNIDLYKRLNRAQVKELCNYIPEQNNFKDKNLLTEQMNNIYIRMEPKDHLEIQYS